MVLAWLACGWAGPAFPADALTPAAAPEAAAQLGDPVDSGNQPTDETMAFLVAGAATPASPATKPASSLRLAPIMFQTGGSLGYDIEQRTVRGGNAQMHQMAIINLRGRARSYIWQPWIAQVNTDLGLTINKSKSNDTGSANNSITGSAGLSLVPYSRYPFQADIQRMQNNTGPGIGSPVSHTTRFSMTQRYRPRASPENYQAGYFRSQSDNAGSDIDKQSGFNLAMDTSRFKDQMINADANRERDMRSQDRNINESSNVRINHRYRPSASLSLDDYANLIGNSEHGTLVSVSTRNREMNSTLSFQPAATFGLVGGARVNVLDSNTLQASSQTRTYNLNLGANYRPSQYVTMSASSNLNETDQGTQRTRVFSTTQNVNANYPLPATELGPYSYSRSVGGSLSNNTSSNASSVQSLSLSAGHGLQHSESLGGDRLGLGMNQTVSVTQSSRSQPAARLTHTGSANWNHVQGKSMTAVRMNGSDSRSLSHTQDSYQSIDLNATISEELSRYASLSGNLSVRTSRQVTMRAPNAIVYTSSSANLHYGHLRAFDVSRLTFSSDLRAYSRAVIPVLVSPPNQQGPIVWENSLNYTVGKLTAIFNVNLSKESDGTSQFLIKLSLRRYF